jgi:predicted PurR-regulated permease PerM
MSEVVATPELPTENARQATARLAFAAAVVLLALWTFAQYLPALGWAGVIAIATWPFYHRLRARFGAHGAALPALFAIFIGLVFLAPVVGAGWFASVEAQAAVHWLDEARKSGVAPPDGLERLPYVGASAAAWWRQNLADPANASSLIKGVDKKPLIAMSEHIGAVAGRRLIVFLFTILALFFLFRDGDSVAASLGRLSERAFGPRGRDIGERIVNSVHGTVDGLVLVGLGEGLVLAIAYYLLGVPQWLLLGAATAVGAIIPFGAFVMFSIAAALLIYKGAIVGAVIIFALGLVVLTAADHVVRPYVIGNATRLPFLFVLVGILGGVEAFGMLGLFLGPAIMAILVDLWREATS